MSVTCADVERVNSALKNGETHNVEHQAPGSAQCVGAAYIRLMWSTMQQGRLNALVLGHVHKVNIEHQAPGSAQCFVLSYVHKVNVEHQAPGSAQCVGAKSCTQG